MNADTQEEAFETYLDAKREEDGNADDDAVLMRDAFLAGILWARGDAYRKLMRIRKEFKDFKL